MMCGTTQKHSNPNALPMTQKRSTLTNSCGPSPRPNSKLISSTFLLLAFVLVPPNSSPSCKPKPSSRWCCSDTNCRSSPFEWTVILRLFVLRAWSLNSLNVKSNFLLFTSCGQFALNSHRNISPVFGSWCFPASVFHQ
jgi:hypothetical protein